MAIDPMGPGGPSDASGRRGAEALGRGKQVAASRSVPAGTADTTAAGDTVELSAEALRLAAGADIPAATISPERLAEITQRIADGVYDGADARDATARGVMGELE